MTQLPLFAGRASAEVEARAAVAACRDRWGESADANAGELTALYLRRAALPEVSTRCPACDEVVAVEACEVSTMGAGFRPYPGVAPHYRLDGRPCRGSLEAAATEEAG